MDIPDIEHFRKMIWDFYAVNRRDFQWRYVEDPYWVLVSEIMLQQTQTFRVEPKFKEFMSKFPSVDALASACWPDVLLAWQGLGYNSRAKRLQQTAQIIVANFGGCVPADSELLIAMPGIGPYTAASVCAFAFNKPTIFVETNIRAVFIYHFFQGKEKVSDAEILPLVSQMLDVTDPRSWYYALMDYGVYIKKQAGNPTRASTSYARQSKFEGSDRQIRSMILRALLVTRSVGFDELVLSIDREPERVARIIEHLCEEKLLVLNYGVVNLI